MARPRNPNPTVYLSLVIDPRVLKKFDEVARSEHRTRSHELRRLIEERIAEHERQAA